LEEIFRRNLDCEVSWLLNDVKNVDTSCFPKKIKIVEYRSKEALQELSEARIILSNVYLIPFLKRGFSKKDNQRYIQTWHGSLGIKKMALANEKNKLDINKMFVYLAESDVENIDYIFSNSDFDDNIFKKYFYPEHFHGKLLRVGHPRNDIFFQPKEKIDLIKKKIYKQFGIPDNKKAVLYVPTFRDNFALDCYTLNAKKLLEALKQRFGNEFVLLVRMHPRLKYQANEIFKFSNEVVNVSEFPDIQELLAVSDAAITDYSSCIFDFVLSRKPGFIFATDIDFYDNDRGFFYPLSETPFPIAADNEKLVSNILGFDENKYKNDVEIFLKGKGCTEDGQACKRAVDLIEQILKEE